MTQEFKKCPNGHYYQGDHCPYCKGSSSQPNVTPAGGRKTEVFADLDNNDGHQPTVISGSNNAGNGGKAGGETEVVGTGNYGSGNYGGSPMQQPRPTSAPSQQSSPSRTVFGDDDDMEPGVGGGRGQRTFRETRKMVGWLVSYTLDPMGVDFKLYEGRNVIGRDIDCNITVNDNMVSARHAVLLFRAGKYSLTDTQSSHGTFVNDTDIELEPYYLQDGDVIRVGQTVFKFRSSF